MTRHLGKARNPSSFRNSEWKCAPKHGNFVLEYSSFSEKKINTSCRICIVLILSTCLTSTVRPESRRTNFRAAAFQGSQETFCSPVAQPNTWGCCLQGGVPAQLVGSGAEEQEKPLSPRAGKLISALSHAFFLKPVFLPHALTVLSTGLQNHYSKSAVGNAMAGSYSWTHVYNSNYSWVY